MRSKQIRDLVTYNSNISRPQPHSEHALVRHGACLRHGSLLNIYHFIEGLRKHPEKIGYLIYVAIGFSAIQSLALHLLGWIPLHITAPLFVLPALVFGVVLGIFFKKLGRLARHGLFAGIVAVAIYDLSRVPFAICGVWGDFIPEIGDWALRTEDTPAVVGYSWRYIGNGGGMGVAFTMLNAFFNLKDGFTRRGILFGVFVFLSLIATMLIASDGQSLLFELTPITFTAGLLGHLIYGYILGLFLDQRPLGPMPS